MPNLIAIFKKPTPGINIVDRGDPEFPDFQFTEFDWDFHELDLSAIIPQGTKWVFLKGFITNNSGGQLFLRAKGKQYNVIAIQQQALAGQPSTESNWLPCSQDLKIEYAFLPPTDWVNPTISVVGWII